MRKSKNQTGSPQEGGITINEATFKSFGFTGGIPKHSYKVTFGPNLEVTPTLRNSILLALCEFLAGTTVFPLTGRQEANLEIPTDFGYRGGRVLAELDLDNHTIHVCGFLTCGTEPTSAVDDNCNGTSKLTIVVL